MHTQGAESDTHENGGGPGLGQAVKNVTDHAKQLVSLELELAKLEVSKKLASFGMGIGLLLGAGLFLFLMLGFLFATIAAVFATFLSTWLALLATTGILLLLAGVLALLGIRAIKKGPPVPKEAIAEAKLTTTALKSDGS